MLGGTYARGHGPRFVCIRCEQQHPAWGVSCSTAARLLDHGEDRIELLEQVERVEARRRAPRPPIDPSIRVAPAVTTSQILTLLRARAKLTRRFEVISDRPDRVVVVIVEVAAVNVSTNEAMDEVREELTPSRLAPEVVRLVVTSGATWRSHGGFKIPLAMMSRERLEGLMIYVEKKIIDATDDEENALALGFGQQELEHFWGEWARLVHLELVRRRTDGDPIDPVLDPSERPSIHGVDPRDVEPGVLGSLPRAADLSVTPPWRHLPIVEPTEDRRMECPRCEMNASPLAPLARLERHEIGRLNHGVCERDGCGYTMPATRS